eukprot:CAMPEP_0170068444 /NCGR_PEP_ID=MMETSP0019_2-20121128/7420_1 /TAXON_ID=98059 /ORGANISM="Dinobryon sp., Strain UTEXLB2267" /LENGTH=320 /DNA_ID=CAMNT_0010276097 /DNA_START=48 /DNA_END=1010 /DNA_ORIENTATION=-
MMKVKSIKMSKKTHPTGDPKFAVMQAFPAGISAEEADPFLMCDHFGPTLSTGRETDPDKFPVGWHPHRGMDILTYMVEGGGRHADSLGNRGEFPSPGMQWISVGSGIEHAEGGGSPKGTTYLGFQIWVNVPSKRKMDDPKYGTEPPENIPFLSNLPSYPGVSARVLAGTVVFPVADSKPITAVGPFKTVQEVQIVDLMLESNATFVHTLQESLNNCIVYLYKGSATICGGKVPTLHVIHLDASDPTTRSITFTAGADGMAAMIFAGKKLNQPIAWHGPFVMTTDEEIRKTIEEYQSGRFLKKRAPFDYKRIAAFPKKEEL